MFIFTRRTLQRMLYGVGRWLPSENVEALATQLNAKGRNRLPTMWELVFLYALGEVMDVDHERPLSSGRRPDFQFDLETGGNMVRVVGDITTVSDADLNAQNPFETLTNAVRRLAKKEGIPTGGFDIEVGHREPGGDREKVQLLIPRGPRFDQLLKRQVRPFLRGIAKNPEKSAELKVEEDGARFAIRYRGPSRFFYGSYRAYNHVSSPQDSTVYRSLKAKADQLRSAPDEAIRLVIVCDGDCAVMGRTTAVAGFFNAHQIANEFLRKTSSVDVALLATVAEDGTSMRYRLLAAPMGCRQPRLTEEVLDGLQAKLEVAMSCIPKPHMTPTNAYRRNLDSEWSESMSGEFLCDSKDVRLSARALQELLAGKVTYERFAADHGWDRGQGNVFLGQLKSGKLFATARIEPREDVDDDWIVFEFGDPDPAVSPFHAIAPQLKSIR